MTSSSFCKCKKYVHISRFNRRTYRGTDERGDRKDVINRLGQFTEPPVAGSAQGQSKPP